nr:transposase [uncultured Carboxylicivirga sp.]
MSSENYLIGDQHATYFVTFTITDWIDVFTRLKYKDLIVDSLRFCQDNKELRIFAWVLMTNHLHMICKTEYPQQLSDLIRDFKQFTAKKLLKLIEEGKESRREWMLYRFQYAGKYDNRIRKYRFWQDKSHPVLMDSNTKLNQRLNYIHNNPVKAGWVLNPEDYPYSSAVNYSGGKGLLDVECI